MDEKTMVNDVLSEIKSELSIYENVITETENQYCMIADGKSRKLSSPKRKNPRHLLFTEKCVDLNNMTDRKLKKILSQYSEELT